MYATTFFPSNSITQFTTPFLSFLTSNIVVIIGVIAFTAGLAAIFAMFQASANGQSITAALDGTYDHDEKKWREFREHNEDVIRRSDEASRENKRLMKEF